MSKISPILLFLLFTSLACGKEESSPSITSPVVPATSPDVTDLTPLIKEGRVKITRDGSLEIISVFGPNQYQTTGTYDCWIHAPFNAWRLFEGDSIESFAGKDWQENLVKEIAKYKKEAGESGSHGGSPDTCLSEAQILKPLSNSPDFSKIDIRADFLGIGQYFPIDPSLIAKLKNFSKTDYEYFSSEDKGKIEINKFKEYQQDCFKALPPTKDFYDLFKKRQKCIDALNEKITKNIYINNNIKPIIDTYLSAKTTDTVKSIINYHYYHRIMLIFKDKIKRLRLGHDQVLVLGFQNSPNEYPLDHAIAAKIVAPQANKIIIINSENRHLEASKTLKMLHQIFNLPLPEELK